MNYVAWISRPNFWRETCLTLWFIPPLDPSCVARWLCMDNYISLLMFGEIHPASALWFKGLTTKSLIFRGLMSDIKGGKQILSRFESHSILFKFKWLNLCMSGEKWEDCLWWQTWKFTICIVYHSWRKLSCSSGIAFYAKKYCNMVFRDSKLSSLYW